MLGQLIINGIAAGGIYALLAVGFALIYNTSRVLHLAHAIVYTFGAYAFYSLTMLVGIWGWVSAPIAVVLTGLFGYLDRDARSDQLLPGLHWLFAIQRIELNWFSAATPSVEVEKPHRWQTDHCRTGRCSVSRKDDRT